MNSRILIIGTSRSGTTFTAAMLRKFGLDFGHEDILSNGGIGWHFAVDEPYPLENRKYRKDFNVTSRIQIKEGFKAILHQIRSPLETIASISTHVEVMFKWIEKITGPFDSDPIVRAAQFWVRWNRLCEKQAEWSYKVEDLKNGSQTLSKLCEYFEIQPRFIDFKNINYNRRRHIDVDWGLLRRKNELIYFEVKDLAQRHGYQKELVH